MYLSKGWSGATLLTVMLDTGPRTGYRRGTKEGTQSRRLQGDTMFGGCLAACAQLY